MSELNIQKIQTKQNNDTLCVNGYYLHSKYDPINEAKRFVEKNFIPNKTIILFGSGIGYISEALKEKIIEGNRLFIIEPLKHSNEIKIRENIIMLETNDIQFIKQSLHEQLDMYEEVSYICSPNYDKIFPELYLEVLKLIKNVIHTQKIMKNTINQFAGLWQKNYLKNLKYVSEDHNLIELENRYNLPIIITSGGPSLNKQLNTLKEIQNSVIIVTAGSAINSLLYHNIQPDYVISIDGGEPNYLHFQNLHIEKSKIIYSLFNHSKIRSSFKERGYYFLSADGSALSNHFKKITGEWVTIVEGGGSVANYALPIAMMMTQGPITFIGQDLAYTNNQSHAENNRFNHPIDEAFKQKRDAFLTKGYYGEDVLTDPVFYTMKEHFESFLKTTTDKRTIFNSTEGGIHIEGMKNLPFKDFCNKYVDTRYTKTENEHTQLLEEQSKKTITLLLKEELILYKKIKMDSFNILEILKKSFKNKGFSDTQLYQIAKYDKKIQDNLKKVPMQIILKPISIDIQKDFQPKENETTVEMYNRICRQNETLYTRIIQATEAMYNCTLELLEEF